MKKKKKLKIEEPEEIFEEMENLSQCGGLCFVGADGMADYAKRLRAAFDKRIKQLEEKNEETLNQLSKEIGNSPELRDVIIDAMGTCAICEMDCHDDTHPNAAKGLGCINKNSMWVPKARKALAKPARNCDRPECSTFEKAYITWVKETQECSDIVWEELGDDEYEQAVELWIHYFHDDQNREFCEWWIDPIEEKKNGRKRN